MTETKHTDILVIGSGLAGLSSAWAAAKRGCHVTLLTRASRPEESNTYQAQGGVIYRAREGAADPLVEDILSAGAGLSSPAAAALLAREGPPLVKKILLDELHVPFDPSSEYPGELDLTSEAGHSAPR
ncbi:MAG: FAD-dependent oxidoreductase, partial [Methylocella sp.]